ncbi:MAG: hypothetical protein MI717_06330 [Spirochaetales bacterium]|nr:hypothetical protein [Spirochaetales bacterium]
MKKIPLVILLSITALGTLAAIDYVPVQVDMVWADNQITSLNTRIDNLTARNDENTQLMNDLKAQNQAMSDQNAQIDALLAELSANTGALYGLLTATRNEETRTTLMDTMRRNREESYALENRKAQNVAQMGENTDKHTSTQRRFVENSLMIQESQDRISWINECMDLTRNSMPDVDSALTTSEDLGSRSSALLQG